MATKVAGRPSASVGVDGSVVVVEASDAVVVVEGAVVVGAPVVATVDEVWSGAVVADGAVVDVGEASPPHAASSIRAAIAIFVRTSATTLLSGRNDSDTSVRPHQT